MGHKNRRRRHQQGLTVQPEPAVVEAPPTAPVQVFGGGWFARAAVAFLIIFVLLWLLAPQETNRE